MISHVPDVPRAPAGTPEGDLAAGRRIAALRERLKIRQDDLATSLDIDRTNLSHIERGKIKGHNYFTVESFARVFGVEIEDIAAYWLKGELGLEELVQRRERGAARAQTALDVAVAYMREAISEEAIRRVRRAAAEAPDRSPMAWGQELARAQAEVLAEGAAPRG